MTPQEPPARRVEPWGRIATRGGIATAVASAVNAVIVIAAEATLDIAPVFEPMDPFRAAFLTIFGGALAIVAYGIVARRADDPDRTFMWVASGGLLVSFVPDLLLLANPQEFPGTTALAVSVLMFMHVVAALIIVLGLTWRSWSD